MEFLDEDARPRFVLQSKSLPETAQISPQSQSLLKPSLLISIALSILLFAVSFLYISSEPFQLLVIWFAASLLVGPFAPASLTAGDIRVGLGPPIPEPEVVPEPQIPDDNGRRSSRRSAKSVTGSGQVSGPLIQNVERNGASVNGNGSAPKLEKAEEKIVNGETEWEDGDDELLKKLMGKNPVGKPGRWEAISQGFNGRHSVESVIKRSKEMGEKRVSDEDSYKKFLKDRKPVAVEKPNEEVQGNGWSSGEDLALLNALKTFPKDVAMRWEKIAVAVPGRSKAACMKRMGELKKDFRSSKSAPGDS